MKVKKVELLNYRNYANLQLAFSPNINVIVGKNAQGKTNLLEAIFFSAIGKSLKANKDNDLIKWQESTAKIKTHIEKKFGTSVIEIIFSTANKKTVKINNIPIRRIGELLGELRCVYFSPDELKLIKESPEDRRRFMDIDISQTSKSYFYLLGKYEKLLATRNKLLKSYKDKIQVIKTAKSYKLIKEENNIKKFEELKELASIYDIQLAETASKIIAFRQNFIENLSPFATKAHLFISSNEENLKIQYQTDFELNLEEVDIKEKAKIYNDKLINLYNQNFEKDIYLSHTSVGPHRDDIEVLLNDIDVRSFGSQGQQRTAALSLKLAEIEIIRQQTGETPILILDDVLSELDLNRRKKLLKFCSLCQTFISSTDIDESLENANIIKIEKGKVIN